MASLVVVALLSVGPVWAVEMFARVDDACGQAEADLDLACHHTMFSLRPDGSVRGTIEVEAQASRGRYTSRWRRYDGLTGVLATEPDTASGDNPSYSFRLSRGGRGWVVSYMFPPEIGYSFGDCQAHIGRGRETYREMLRSSTSSPNVRPVAWGDRPAVEVRFSIVRPAAGPDKPEFVFRGVLVVHPTPPAVVCGYRHYDDPNDPDRCTSHLAIRYTAGESQHLESVEHWYSQTSEGILALGSRSVMRSYTRLTQPPSPEAFTLTAFGLPEPATLPIPMPPLDSDGQLREPDRPAAAAIPDRPAEGRWLGPVIAGIVVVGAVAFWRAGRRPGTKA